MPRDGGQERPQPAPADPFGRSASSPGGGRAPANIGMAVPVESPSTPTVPTATGVPTPVASPELVRVEEILDAADEAAEGHRVRMPELAREVRSLVVRTLAEGGREAKLTLTPPQLGQVKLTLTERGGQVFLHMEVESLLVRDQLLSAQAELGDDLRQQGIELTRLEIDVQDRRAGDETTGDPGSSGEGHAPTDERDPAPSTTSDHEPSSSPALGRVDVMA